MNGNIHHENGNLHCEIGSIAMEATGYKVFNDSVHGHITLHPLLVRVVDTPQFQRLRNIKQLGPANFVFPGASSCRYEHSLGTCYLAGQMVERLLEREEQVRPAGERQKLSLCVQLAALCHDLGHGPFSHTWEQVTQRWNDNWKHEEASLKLFDNLIESNNLVGLFSKYGLTNFEREIIKELIMGGPLDSSKPPLLEPEDNFLYEIVSNKETGIDVDKWDYFLRDGLHLNLSITFDYRRLLGFCTVVKCKGRTHIAFRDKEIMNLYDMFRVRSALHHTAYKHRVVLNIELMFVDAFAAAGDAGYKINNSEILLKEAHKSPESMSEMTDHIFYDILYSRDPRLATAKALLNRVLQRKLYVFVEKANIQLDKNQTVKEKQEYIAERKNALMIKLAESCPKYEFAVKEFFLELDSRNDPVSKVKFYTKQRGSNQIELRDYKTIKDLLDPFPFQLTSVPTAALSVFCKKEGVTDQDLVDAKRLIRDFSLK